MQRVFDRLVVPKLLRSVAKDFELELTVGIRLAYFKFSFFDCLLRKG